MWKTTATRPSAKLFKIYLSFIQFIFIMVEQYGTNGL